MSASVTTNLLQARRAYELGRVRSSLWRGAILATAILGFGLVVAGRSSLPVAPLTWGLWVFVYWRGEAMLRGAFHGLAGGVVTSLLPMSILRPCCKPGMPMGPDCCTMPGACLFAGAVVGIVLASVVPFGRQSWWRNAVGIVAGMTSITLLRCPTLFAGEALGLLGGIAAGVAVASGARFLFALRAQA